MGEAKRRKENLGEDYGRGEDKEIAAQMVKNDVKRAARALRGQFAPQDVFAPGMRCQ
jgi:Protein of unknown function (DUF2839)